MTGLPLAVVVVASTRAAAGGSQDRTGPLLADRLSEWGYAVLGPVVVADGPDVGRAIGEALASGPALVVTTGGTGIAPADLTPEQTEPFLDRLLPGIPEAIRAAGVSAGVATSVLSRGLAGIAGSTLVVNLPGSPGGVRDALGILEGVLAHARDQLGGGDHASHEAPAAGTATGADKG